MAKDKLTPFDESLIDAIEKDTPAREARTRHHANIGIGVTIEQKREPTCQCAVQHRLKRGFTTHVPGCPLGKRVTVSITGQALAYLDKGNVKEPAMGWEAGFRFLMVGLCPYCGTRASVPTADARYGLTWSCSQGCNP